MKKMVVIMNRKAGRLSGAFSETRRSRFTDMVQQTCRNVDVYWTDPRDLDRTIDKALSAGPDIIAVGGGDGTLSSAAARLVGTDVVLGVIPAGTFNLIARDLSAHLSMKQAAADIAAGAPLLMDAGELNGHIFLHHASLGIHPKTIALREAYRRKLGVGKLVTTGVALAWILTNPPSTRLHVATDSGTFNVHTPFLFIGANRFETGPFQFIRRETFDAARLGVFYTPRGKTADLLRMIVRTFLEKRLTNVRHLNGFQTERLTVDSEKTRLKMSLDGELKAFEPPVSIRIRPGALRVIAGSLCGAP